MEDQVVDGRIILKCIFKKWDGGMDWIYLAQDRARWWGLANTKWNLRVPYSIWAAIYCLTCNKILYSYPNDGLLRPKHVAFSHIIWTESCRLHFNNY